MFLINPLDLLTLDEIRELALDGCAQAIGYLAQIGEVAHC